MPELRQVDFEERGVLPALRVPGGVGVEQLPLVRGVGGGGFEVLLEVRVGAERGDAEGVLRGPLAPVGGGLR